MRAATIVAIVLIVLGVLGLVYERFSYTKETHEADLGPLELEVKEKRTVDIPTWMPLAAIGAGVVLLVVPKRKKS